MNLIAINGSPRKHWNTAQLLEQVVAGAAKAGMTTELTHLYDMDFRGCISCFACKRLGGKSYGRCAVKDGLTPLLDRIHTADALVIGSPVYLYAETGETRSFLERAVFQYLRYANPPATLFPRRIRTALVYTMNVGADMAGEIVEKRAEMTKSFMERIFGPCDIFYCHDTLQYDDYSLYDNTLFDPEAKKLRNREVFPQDLARAFELGNRMAEPLE